MYVLCSTYNFHIELKVYSHFIHQIKEPKVTKKILLTLDIILTKEYIKNMHKMKFIERKRKKYKSKILLNNKKKTKRKEGDMQRDIGKNLRRKYAQTDESFLKINRGNMHFVRPQNPKMSHFRKIIHIIFAVHILDD